jgi:hypothetical protein
MRFVNPIIKLELRTPLARLLPWGTLGFDGRRSGRRIEVVVRMYRLDGKPVSFSPNPWRANFTEPRHASLRWKGRLHEHEVVLVRDPSEVAAALNQLVDDGLWVPAGIRVRGGGHFTVEDIASVNVAMLRFS